MNYFNELKRSMNYLAQDERVFFLGQAVKSDGTALRKTLLEVDSERLIEFPVAEDMQMGVSLGASLSNDFILVTIFPRLNFLILAANQIFNHIDLISKMSDFKPKIIIRSAIGSEHPLHGQHQHTGDLTQIFKEGCKTIEVIRLDKSEMIFPSYEKALTRNDGRSTMLIEWADAYSEEWYEKNLADKP